MKNRSKLSTIASQSTETQIFWHFRTVLGAKSACLLVFFVSAKIYLLIQNKGGSY